MVSHFNLNHSLKEAKILSIDDDEWFVRLLIKKFEDVDPGFKITPAYSANEAVEILQSESFDCILCDHKLPGTITVKGKIFPADGIHLMRKFIDELKIDTPVIFVTGQGSEEIASQALLQGASGYFIKRVQPGYYSLMATSIRQTIDRYWLQRELQKSEARYRDLFENSAGLIFIFDSQGSLQESNKELLDTYGYTLEESQDLTYKELAYNDDLNKWKEMLDMINQGNSEIRMLRSITKDGQILHLDITGRPIFAKKTKKVIGIQAIARDITHQVKTQQALIDSEEKHRKIIEGTIEGIAIMDKEGIILDWNPAATVITGFSQEETLGKYIRDIIMELNPKTVESQPDLSPEADSVHNKFQEILKSEDHPRKPLSFKYSIENVKIGTQRILESVGFTIEHSRGYRVALIMRDVTERHIAEVESRSFAKRFQILIEQTPIGVWVSEIADERTTYVNDSVAQLLGYSPHEIIGVSVLDFVTPKSAEIIKERTRKRIAGKIPKDTYELVFYHRSGKKIYTLITAAAIKGEDGELQETYGFMRDITAEKEQERELRKTKEFLESIISSMPSGLYTYDQNYKITMANDRLVEILGYTSPQKLIGKNLLDLFPDYEQDRVKKLVIERMNGQKSEGFLLLTYISAQGNEIKTSVSSVPLIVDGNVEGAAVTVTDITEQKRIEMYLQQIQNEYNEIITNVPLGFIKINNLGQIISYNENAQKILAFTGLTDLKSLNVLQNHLLKKAGLANKFRDMIYQKKIIKGDFIHSKIEDNQGKIHILDFYPFPIQYESEPSVHAWILFIKHTSNSKLNDNIKSL
ncbi:MAG: PAS domain S-box protein [Candidatus Hodarchaeota archaeon]